MDIPKPIYEPKARAKEYGDLAVNIPHEPGEEAWSEGYALARKWGLVPEEGQGDE